MPRYDIKELSQVAMEIILHAGNGRNYVEKALIALETNLDYSEYENLMSEANKEIVQAHRAQTDVIQTTIEEENMTFSLLFSHAQDTLMTIVSEYNIAKHLGKLYKVVIERTEK